MPKDKLAAVQEKHRQVIQMAGAIIDKHLDNEDRIRPEEMPRGNQKSLFENRPSNKLNQSSNSPSIFSTILESCADLAKCLLNFIFATVVKGVNLIAGLSWDRSKPDNSGHTTHVTINHTIIVNPSERASEVCSQLSTRHLQMAIRSGNKDARER